jgi:hypothetical protein
MSFHQNTGQNHNIKIANSSSENVAKLKYLRITVTIQNFIHDKMKSTLSSGNACWYSVQDISSSHLLSKNVKIKIFRTIILPAILYGCETGSLTLREKHRLSVSERTTC